MKVDLHIHSALSPCGSDDMTPNNIINMASICELDMISVCDHNTLGQQEVLGRVAEKLGMKYIYGVEVQSVEDVHVCGYFQNLNDVQKFQEEKEKPAKHWTEDRVMNTFVEQTLAGLRRNAEEKLKHFRRELEEEESFGRR